ncbi:MAG: hypothetical protein ACPLXC_01415 [Candidatus Pacearchaeota archaeon]
MGMFGYEEMLRPLLGASILAFIGTLLVLWIIMGIVIYVYYSWAFMSIGKKVKFKYPGLAWIPAVGPLIITSQAAKMPWWPILLLAGFWIPVVGVILNLVIMVFSVIWLWKTFEEVDRPGWWAILCLIPIVNLVLIGIAAWSK